MTKSQQLCPCEFLIPLSDNDGKAFDPAVFIEIKLALDRQFGGFHVLGHREGSWLGQVEISLALCVAVPPERVNELKEVVKAIGKRLGQKQMYFEQRPPSVDLIDVEDSD